MRVINKKEDFAHFDPLFINKTIPMDYPSQILTDLDITYKFGKKDNTTIDSIYCRPNFQTSVESLGPKIFLLVSRKTEMVTGPDDKLIEKSYGLMFTNKKVFTRCHTIHQVFDKAIFFKSFTDAGSVLEEAIKKKTDLAIIRQLQKPKWYERTGNWKFDQEHYNNCAYQYRKHWYIRLVRSNLNGPETLESEIYNRTFQIKDSEKENLTKEINKIIKKKRDLYKNNMKNTFLLEIDTETMEIIETPVADLVDELATLSLL